jgi:8-amino-7-oxononanoate synthase
MPSLDDKLNSALNSREARHIRRRLPPPTSPSDDPNKPENLIDFNSNDYLSLSSSQTLRDLFLSKLRAAPDILGSGGSRLLVNGKAHADLESRLSTIFRAPAALLFNSGFDANVSFFSCIPQRRDFIVYDEYIHASVHDGIRASRTTPSARRPFGHNSVPSIREVLLTLRDSHACLRSGADSVFVAVESLYSMDGTFAPLQEIVDMLKEFFPMGNGYLVVDEAHATGIYGPQGRGVVAMLGLEDRVLARLHTFGKALAATGGTCCPVEESVSKCFHTHASSSCDHNEYSYTRLFIKLCSVVDLHHVTQFREYRGG